MEAHCKNGGRAAFVRRDAIILAESGAERRLCSLNDVAIPLQGHFTFHIESVLASIGTVWALGLDDESIAAGLRSFGAANAEPPVESLAA